MTTTVLTGDYGRERKRRCVLQSLVPALKSGWDDNPHRAVVPFQPPDRRVMIKWWTNTRREKHVSIRRNPWSRRTWTPGFLWWPIILYTNNPRLLFRNRPRHRPEADAHDLVLFLHHPWTLPNLALQLPLPHPWWKQKKWNEIPPPYKSSSQVYRLYAGLWRRYQKNFTGNVGSPDVDRIAFVFYLNYFVFHIYIY